MISKPTLFAVTSLTLALAANLSAADWPEFRGAAAQGHSDATNLPLTWSPNSHVAWKTPVAGIGWSSPVVVGTRIFLTSAVSLNGKEEATADRSLRVISLDATTGKTVWDVELFTATAPRAHRKNSHASPTPVFENGRLYVHFGHLGTACLDATTGKSIWATQEFAYSPVHGNGGSPVLFEDLLIFSADAETAPKVIALDKNTGKQRWTFARQSEAKKKFSFCTPLIIDVNGQKQLITPGSGVVNALNPKDGTEIWRFNYDQGYSVVPRPIFAHGLIFISTGFDKPLVLAIKPDGKGDVTATHLAWSIDKAAPHDPSMVVIGDELYFIADNGILSCVDAKTGQVHYQERCTGPISASPLVADGKLYLQDEKGLGVVVKPGKTFQILAKNDLAERSLASYAVIGSDLLIRTEANLYRIKK
ncbi:PQQ-binding-like beta-propeller repeat protein [Prosthecobacter sp.]|uniref:PQQ-binding-like beta-propeller repeat protein n=1 Tax=Prosthecobacter sp. TaxID=1965333 RepID=UPI002ABCE92B|nr:PQQ-binding-like beta-propeller repeat protein [Prosthecobacter sp.]MDZ4405503.1 PQQ-binding-like beta-propeller repeat protein [Prosthecobacter sp.]